MREGLSDGIQQRPQRKRISHRDICRVDGLPDRGNCICKGPEVEVWLRRTKRLVYMDGVIKRRVGAVEVRDSQRSSKVGNVASS